MNKKIMLTLGSIVATAAPISAVIACSPGTDMGEKESKFLAALKSKDGIRKINGSWLDIAIKNIYKNSNTTVNNAAVRSDLKSYIKFYVNDQLMKNNEYLQNLYGSWISEIKDQNKKDKLISDYKMNTSYKTIKEWESAMNNSKTLETFISDYVFGANYEIGYSEKPKNADGTNNPNYDASKDNGAISKKTDFLVIMKQALITKSYLSVSKDKWMSVFGDDTKEKIYDNALKSNQDTWNLIDDNRFPLILEGMRKHYAYSWKINLNEREDVNQYSQMKDTAENIALKFKETTPNSLADKVNRTESMKKIVDEYVTIDASNSNDEANYVGYQGVSPMPQGKGAINFLWNDVKNWKDQKTDSVILKGFVDKQKLVNTESSNTQELEYVKQGAKEVNLTLYEGTGLIPTYNTTDNKIKFSNIQSGKEDNLFWIFISKNQELYEKAVQYYTNKEDPIQLDIDGDEYLKQVLIDAGVKFIKE